MMVGDERMHILEMIENGQISAAEGLRLLEELAEEVALDDVSPDDGLSSLDDDVALAEAPIDGDYPGEADVYPGNSTSDFLSTARKWQRWWWIPLAVGIGVAVMGALFMLGAIVNAGYGFWFFCTWVPILLGVLIIILAWTSRGAPWLHLRVKQSPGERPQRIAFSFPIPIRPTAWFLRTFGSRIPSLEGTSLDEIILALGESTSPENPIFIQVDEGDEGEKVEIYIG